MPKNKGFTLIELLVVIAIMGLLSSIVLVTIDLPAQKQKARIAKTLEFSSSIHSALGAEAVGIWDFDNNLNDSSGYGNNATCSNCPGYSSDTPYKELGSGQGKYSLSFDGVNDEIKVPSSAKISFGLTSGTFSFWLYVDPNQSDISSVGLLNKNNGTFPGYFASIRNHLLFRLWKTGAIQLTVEGKTTIQKGQWHHVAFVIDRPNNNLIIYLDGKNDVNTLVSEGGFYPAQNVSNSFPLSISSTLVGETDKFLQSKIDDFRIYERVLALGQIQQIYAEGLKNHQNLAAK